MFKLVVFWFAVGALLSVIGVPLLIIAAFAFFVQLGLGKLSLKSTQRRLVCKQ